MLYRRKWPWIGEQTWRDIIFLHWPVRKEIIRPFIPDPFTICKFNDLAWLTLVYFTATETRGRKMFSKFTYPNFKQANLRTYVQFGQEIGVYFLSLYANDPLVAKGGSFFGLPFRYTPIFREIGSGKDKLIIKNKLISQVKQKKEPFNPMRNSLEQFVTERYCIWLIKGKRIVKVPVSHIPWTLHKVNVHLKMKKFIPKDLHLPAEPISHYSSFMTAYLHPFETFGYYHK